MNITIDRLKLSADFKTMQDHVNRSTWKPLSRAAAYTGTRRLKGKKGFGNATK